MHIELDLIKAWKLYRKQCDFAFSDSYQTLMLGGVGSGKSHALTAWTIARALKNPRTTTLLLGRTGNDLQGVLLPHLEDRFIEIQEQCGVHLVKSRDKFNGMITLLNGAKIAYRPYNRADKLRGWSVANIAVDEVEFAECDPDDLYTILLGRLRQKCELPGIAFATSPAGYTGVSRRFVDAQRLYRDAVLAGDAAGIARYGKSRIVTATSHDNPYLSELYLEGMKNMSARRYEAEVMGKVLRPQNSVWNLKPAHFIRHNWRDNPGLTTILGVDWGTYGHHAALMMQILPTGQVVVCDELYLDDAPQNQFLATLQAWIDERPHIRLAGVDRAIPHLNTQFKKQNPGIQVVWKEGHDEQMVVPGIETVRDLLEPFEGAPKILFADSLRQTSPGETDPIIPAIRQYSYKLDHDRNPTNAIYKDNRSDHACDAFRYAITSAIDKRLISAPIATQVGVGVQGGKVRIGANT